MLGIVKKSVGNKTIMVEVIKRVMHPLYRKMSSKSSRYLVHDELNKYKKGDSVNIVLCRPLSAKKRYMVK